MLQKNTLKKKKVPKVNKDYRISTLKCCYLPILCNYLKFTVFFFFFLQLICIILIKVNNLNNVLIKMIKKNIEFEILL